MTSPPILRVLRSNINLQIISLLREGAFNTRELSRILGKKESDVSRRLKLMERTGLVRGEWVRVRGRNIKVYSLRTEEIHVSFRTGEIRIVMGGTESTYKVRFMPDPSPVAADLVGMEREMRLIENGPCVVVVYGMAGVGKTSLVARVAKDAFWYGFTGTEGFEYFQWQLALALNTVGFLELIEYLRYGGRDERAIAEMTLRGMEESGLTVVLDDFHKCNDTSVMSLVRFLVGKLRTGRLFIISRRKPLLGVLGQRPRCPFEGVERRRCVRTPEVARGQDKCGRFPERLQDNHGAPTGPHAHR